MGQVYRHKNTSIFLLNYHFVWIPRRRRQVLKNEVEEDLKTLIKEKAQELKCEIIELEIMPDHVHLFINCPPSIAPDQIMHRIKGYTAKILRTKHTHLMRMPSMWTRSYFVSTAGNVSSDTVKKYISQQKSR